VPTGFKQLGEKRGKTIGPVRSDERERMSRILREREVKHVTGLSRVTRWRLERRGLFPKKVRLTERCIGWQEAEIMAWLRSRSEARG
jgi:prophage regulatory protein